jgi:cardiolipin synthase
VRILTAGSNSDVKLVQWASQQVYSNFLRSGVKIYELDTRLHAKTFTVDGASSMIGSFNLDYWSWAANLETNLLVTDNTFTNKVDQQFFRDVTNSREITLKALKQEKLSTRFFSWCAYILCKILRPSRE